MSISHSEAEQLHVAMHNRVTAQIALLREVVRSTPKHELRSDIVENLLNEDTSQLNYHELCRLEWELAECIICDCDGRDGSEVL